MIAVIPATRKAALKPAPIAIVAPSSGPIALETLTETP